MSQAEVYQGIKAYLGSYLPELSQWTLDRVTLLVSGMIKAQHAAPARIAQASQTLGERGTKAESIERRIRRIENDPKIRVETCFQPFVRAVLANSHLQEALLILDPTTQEDRVVLVSLNLWYRGRSLPLAWDCFPANQALKGAGLMERVGKLFQQAKDLLPAGLPVTVLADRAFGIPSFIDLVHQLRWHWMVRVKGTVRCRDRQGRVTTIQQLVQERGARRKLYGEVFKKAGWRSAHLAIHWGKRYRSPLSVLSDQPRGWEMLHGYRRRFAIEPSFRDWKSSGWHWEQGQVTDFDHLQRLILGMALASWLVILVGALQAGVLLRQPVRGRRRTRPWWAKFSLFQLGLQVWSLAFDVGLLPILLAGLPDCAAPNWSIQFTVRYAKAFVFT